MVKSDTSVAPARDRASPAKAALYRTGAAARLAGVPAETLRVWERRYDIVGPSLSPRGQRLYTAEQVKRLSLIKHLVDLGNPVSTLAQLSDEDLAGMHATSRELSSAAARAGSALGRPVRTVLVGESFAARLAAELGREPGLDIAATCADVAHAPEALAGVRADILVVELPALLEGAMAAVEETREIVGAFTAVVLYRFGQRDTIRRLRRKGCVVARMPLDPAEIETLCRAALAAYPVARDDAGAQAPQPASGPRFDENALTELARASSTVYCECPRHLVELLRMLGSFERYSAECQNRSPEDAELHRDLGRTAAEARALLEEALVRVAQAEGLALPGGGNGGAR